MWKESSRCGSFFVGSLREALLAWPLLFGPFVEWQRDLLCAYLLIGTDLDEDVCAGSCYFSRHERHGDVGLEERRGRAGRDGADLLPVRRPHEVPVARDAAFDHFQADDFALWTAVGLHGEQRIATEKCALVELEEAIEAGFEDVDLVGDFV